MRLKDAYYELVELRNKEKAVEVLKESKAVNNMLFTEKDKERLDILKGIIRDNKEYFDVEYSVLVSAVMDSLNKQANGKYWNLDVIEDENQENKECCEETERYIIRQYTVALKFGDKRFIIAKIGTVTNDVYWSLSWGNANVKVNLFDNELDINLKKLANYHLNTPKKNPIEYMCALERGVWDAIKKNKVLQLTKQMTEKRKDLKEAETKVETLTKDIETLEAEIKDAEM